MLFCILALIENGIQIIFDYVRQLGFSGSIGKAYSYFCNYNHVCLGVFLFLLMKTVFDKMPIVNHSRTIGFLNISDKYSYEAYLVHQFLILGPMSLMTITP